MRFSHSYQAVETHCEGLPIRVITGGVPAMPGRNMAERREWFIENSDHIRTLLMNEPRGHGALSGAILQPSTRDDADWGVLFIEVTGVLPMCGAGTMSVATVLVEMGMVPVQEPYTTVRLDTPIGLITASVQVNDGKAETVTIENVPSFSYSVNQQVSIPEAPELSTVGYDMAFGGNFYAFVETEQLGIPFTSDQRERFERLGAQIMAAINTSSEPVHPETGYRGCEHVVFLAPGSDEQHTRHALINSPGWLDRSPGGTGTSARMAHLYSEGKLDLNQEFVNESFIGTSFTGRLVDHCTVGTHDAAVPQITGSCWITGMGQHLLDPSDPFPKGFTI